MCIDGIMANWLFKKNLLITELIKQVSGQNKIPFTSLCLDGAEPFETDNSKTWRNTTKATWLQSTVGKRKQQWWENKFLAELITMPLSRLFKSIPEVSADSKK